MEQKTVYLIMEESTENFPRLVIGCYADKEKAKQYYTDSSIKDVVSYATKRKDPCGLRTRVSAYAASYR